MKKEHLRSCAIMGAIPAVPLVLCLAATCVTESLTRNTTPPNRSKAAPIHDNAQSYSVSFRLDEVRRYPVKDGMIVVVPGIDIRDQEYPCYTQTSDKIFPDHPFINTEDCMPDPVKPIPPRRSLLYFHFNDFTLPKVVTGTFQLDMKKSSTDLYSQNGGFFRYQIEITP